MQIINDDGVDWDDIDYGNCTECGDALEENEYAIGNVCYGCTPAFMESWEARQEAEQERREEERRYPEVSDDDYRCDHCGGDVRPSSWDCMNPYCED